MSTAPHAVARHPVRFRGAPGFTGGQPWLASGIEENLRMISQGLDRIDDAPLQRVLVGSQRLIKGHDYTYTLGKGHCGFLHVPMPLRTYDILSGKTT